MRALGPAALVLISYAIIMTYYALALRHRIRASHDPLLVLPKKDRINYARELLDRQQEEYEEAKTARLETRVKRFNDPWSGTTPTHKEEELN